MKKRYLLCFASGLAIGAALMAGVDNYRVKPTSVVQTETIVQLVRDTVVIRTPQRVARHWIADRVTAEAVDSIAADSVAAAADSAGCYEQCVYQGDDYKAWVSGIDPRLDSIAIAHVSVASVTTAPTDVSASRQADKRWHLGVFGGCAVTPTGIQPAVGIGITYSFCSW